MERPAKLADLKLVNKYYPPVSNYSYPRPEGGPRQERPVGRSSVGSDCSAPGMTDDQESDISAEDATQYHSAGDELWDKFWEDSGSLCDARLEEEDHRAEVSRNARYPALIPSPVARRKAAGLPPKEDRRLDFQARNQEAVEQNASVSCWPLLAAQRPVTPESKPVKASYSLFPQPKPIPIVNLTPRRPSRPPRSGFVWETSLHCPSSALPQMSPAGRTTKPKRLHLPTSDGAISYNSASSFTTHSAPVSPTVRDPSPPSAATMARRSEPSALAQPRQAMVLPRICSDTPVLYSMATNTASQETLTAPTIPPRSPQRRTGRHSRQHSQLRNSITPAEVSSTTPTKPRAQTTTPRTSQTLSVSDIDTTTTTATTTTTTTQWPCTPPPPPPPPSRSSPPRQQQQQHQQEGEELPVPVSVFELDSDDDNDSDDEGVNFARRIVRNLTPHKRTRSAAAAPRTARKGGGLAKEQLRRARAGTLSPTSNTSTAAAVRGITPEMGGAAEDRDKERDAVLLGARRQRNEVFGRLFGGRW